MSSLQNETNPHFLPNHQHQHQQQQHLRKDPSAHRHHDHLKVPQPRRTKPTTWFVAFFCVILWVIIILIGLAVLIVYLVFRPNNPRFDISAATLNAAYLDTGTLLNSDITLLANFTNPNQKVRVDYSYMVLDLYYQNNHIATAAVDPFSATRGESKLHNIHMVTSQVSLPLKDADLLTKQMVNNTVIFRVEGSFRTRSNLGNFLHYSYWLHGRCSMELTGPPSGVLRSHRCRTKR